MFLFLYLRAKKKRTIPASNTEKWALALAWLGLDPLEKKRLCTFSSNRQILKWWREANDSAATQKNMLWNITQTYIYRVCALLKPYFLRIISPSSSSVTRFTGIRLLSVCGPPTHTHTIWIQNSHLDIIWYIYLTLVFHFPSFTRLVCSLSPIPTHVILARPQCWHCMHAPNIEVISFQFRILCAKRMVVGAQK